MSLLNYKTLQLTAAGIPTAIVSCKRAINLVSTEKAIVRAYYDETLIHSSPAFVMMNSWLKKSENEMLVMSIPSVIQCTKSEYEPKKYTKVLKFNRKNVYIRDGGICQYCGKKVALSEFTFDHVVPKKEGGITWWTNIVVSCARCNSQKSCKSLGKYHRKLIRKPTPLMIDKAAPEHIVNQLATEIPHKTWIDYVYWNVILDR